MRSRTNPCIPSLLLLPGLTSLLKGTSLDCTVDLDVYDPPRPASPSSETLLLATGSADPFVYIYALTTTPSVQTPVSSTTIAPLLAPSTTFSESGASISGGAVASGSATAVASPPTGACELIQRIGGHSDRVYAVDFHPTDLTFASCSADFGVKVMALRRRDM